MGAPSAKDEERIESREDEKCMNGSNETDVEKSATWQKRMEGVHTSAKNFFGDKHKLILFILAILLFVLIIIVIVLAAKLGTITCEQPQIDCDSPACLMAASSLKQGMNDSIDPCKNFWQFACGGWNALHPPDDKKGGWDVRDVVQLKIEQRLRILIDKIPQQAALHTALHKLHTFYSSCMQVESLEYRPWSALEQIIQEVGGWRLMNNWQISRWDRDMVLAKLHADYAVDAFFTVDVARDDASQTNIIKLSPAGLGLPSKDYYFKSSDDPLLLAYREFIKDTIMLLKQANGLDVAKFAEEMISFEKRLAKITPNKTETRNKLESYRVLTISELNVLAAMVKWQPLLELYFPKSIISPDTQVAITSPSYFKELSRLLSTTDNEVLNDYYMWRLLSINAQHLSRDFRRVVASFQRALDGVTAITLPEEERWRYCIQLSDRFFSHAFTSLYVKHYFPSQKVHEVSLLVDHLLASLVGQVESMPWLQTNSEHEILREKIKNLKVKVGFPTFVLNDNELDEFYSSLNVQISYFQNILKAIEFGQKLKQTLLLNPFMFSWKSSSQAPEVLYYPNGNILTIAAGVLEAPFFELDYPPAEIYGALSAYLTPRILEMMDDLGIQYRQDGILENWLTNSSRDIFHTRFNSCLDLLKPLLPTNGEPQMQDIVTSIGALELTYQTMKRLVKEDLNKVPIPSIQLSNDQLFFLFYAQSQCQTLTPKKALILSDVHGTISNEERLNFVLQQVPKFWEVFNCPKPQSSPRCPRLW